MREQTQIVQQLPSNPQQGANYSFARISRQEVTYATHGMHKYPAKFIPQFPQWALDYKSDEVFDSVLDPFCGSGTTLVEAGRRGCNAVGVDISPLACALTEAKCLMGVDLAEANCYLDKTLIQARARQPSIREALDKKRGESILGMHYTWSNWFDPENLAGLLALREVINLSEKPELKIFALASLSSITKSCSYLNEDQIKVRFDHNKLPREPVSAFEEAFKQGIVSQSILAREYAEKGAAFSVIQGSAADLSINDGTIDRIITSPPYINAVDYTMAHKYNLFVLGLLDPDKFKDHCREYIGVTERAVRASDLKALPNCSSHRAREIIQKIQALNTPTSNNRAFVTAQYFSGMEASFKEAVRVLRPRGLYFLVVGETNRICGITVKTAEILEEIANGTGLLTELSFYHVLANRSSMRMNRSETGGTITREHVYVFRKQ